ncbi:MAG: hypothetical protein WC436_06530 [Candidatus Babeliales bacterium]
MLMPDEIRYLEIAVDRAAAAGDDFTQAIKVAETEIDEIQAVLDTHRSRLALIKTHAGKANLEAEGAGS